MGEYIKIKKPYKRDLGLKKKLSSHRVGLDGIDGHKPSLVDLDGRRPEIC